METAAKKKNSLALGVIASMIAWVSACLLSSAATASSVSDVGPKTRAEIFLGVPSKSVEVLDVNPANATRYYDVFGGVVLECTVAPVSGGLVPTGARRLGAWGEARLENLFGGLGTKPLKPFMTSDGPRYVDRLLNGIAHESKAGIDVKLTNSFWRQMLKDKELIDEGIVKGAHWHFWQGASKEVLDTLTSLGIKFTVH